MKRIIALFMFFTYIFSCTTAFADRYDDLYSYTDFIPEQGFICADISLENFSDFEYLKIFDEKIAPYSMAEIFSGIANSKIHIEADYKIISNKITKAYIRANFLSPIKMNDSLRIEADALFHIWIDTDFRNSREPYYKITVKTPFSAKYIVFESTDKNSILFYPAQGRTEQIISSVKEALRENSHLTFENNTYNLSIDETGFENIAGYVIEDSYNYLYLFFNGTNTDKQKHAKYKSELPLIIERLRNVKLLGNSGILKRLKFNTEGKITESELNLDIDTNIFKLFYAITGNTLPTDPSVPRPLVNVQNSDFKMKINLKMNFSENFTEFSFPRVSKRLVYRVFEADDYAVQYTTSEENITPYETIEVVTDGFIYLNNQIPYIPLRTMMNSLGIPDKSIIWNNGQIKITDDVVPLLPFKDITLTEGNSEIIADGILTALNAPLVTINDTVYVPEDFVSKILDASVTEYKTWFDFESQSYKTTIYIERLKPVYYIQLKNSAVSIIN